MDNLVQSPNDNWARNISPVAVMAVIFSLIELFVLFMSMAAQGTNSMVPGGGVGIFILFGLPSAVIALIASMLLITRKTIPLLGYILIVVTLAVLTSFWLLILNL